MDTLPKLPSLLHHLPVILPPEQCSMKGIQLSCSQLDTLKPKPRKVSTALVRKTTSSHFRSVKSKGVIARIKCVTSGLESANERYQLFCETWPLHPQVCPCMWDLNIGRWCCWLAARPDSAILVPPTNPTGRDRH